MLWSAHFQHGVHAGRRLSRNRLRPEVRPTRYEHDEFVPPEVVVLWGKEPLRSNPDGMYGHAVIEMMRQFGTKLICVDPRMTWLGTRSEIVLQVKPGTDTAMAMAWIHVMEPRKAWWTANG